MNITATLKTAVIALTLVSTGLAQSIDIRQRAEATSRFLNDLAAQLQADGEVLRAFLELRPPLDPKAVELAREKQRYAKRRELAPWLFGSDGLPNANGREFFSNKAGRDRALAASRLTPLRPKISPGWLIGQRGTSPDELPALVVEGPVEGGEDPLYLTSSYYDAQQNLTWFELILENAPLNEWWEVYQTPSLQSPQSTAWILRRYGPPDGVSGNLQQFLVAVPGQPNEAYFQIFLNKDSDYDGVPDGYEIAILQTDPLNPDSNSTRDINGDGLPDYPGLGGNGVVDGDEDFDADGMSTWYELSLGTDPLVPESGTDSDGDGLPDWLEDYITFWTQVTNPGPWDDSDNDGLSNLDEFHAELDPAAADFLLFNPPLDEHQRFVEDTVDPRLIVDANYPLVSGAGGGSPPSPPVHKFFPGEVMIGGVLNMAGSVVVLVDEDASGNPAPGKASVRWSICSLSPLINMIPSFPDPDTLDGQNWLGLLINGTDLANDVWAEVNEGVLQSLRQKTLEHIQGVSSLRVAVEFRKIQYLQTVGVLSDGSVIRIRRSISVIHTEATKLTAVTMRYGEAYPSLFQSQFLRYGAGGIKLLANGLSWWQNLSELRVRFQAYCHNVRLFCDGSEPALLSIAIQNLMGDCPGWSQATRNVMGVFQTTPLFDPDPLGLYEGGGNDCN